MVAYFRFLAIDLLYDVLLPLLVIFLPLLLSFVLMTLANSVRDSLHFRGRWSEVLSHILGISGGLLAFGWTIFIAYAVLNIDVLNLWYFVCSLLLLILIWLNTSLTEAIKEERPVLCRVIRIVSCCLLVFPIFVFPQFLLGYLSIAIVILVPAGAFALFYSVGILAKRVLESKKRVRIGREEFTFDAKAKEKFTEEELKTIVAAIEEVRNARKKDT
jgi:hypothetical protein